MVKLAEHLSVNDILLGVDVPNKSGLFELVGQHMEQTHKLPRHCVTTSLLRREQAGSTGLGDGVAVPHARLSELDTIHALYLRPRGPMAFNASDRKPVSDIVVLLVPAPAAPLHLDLLAEIARLFSDHNFREELDQCENEQEIMSLLDRS
ncbi:MULTISPECIES: PTS sugar transporter subunit IIA [unclassified Pseudomonas]|jgi:PTS system nitrogen regulatory IIA component|uniref:PTS sugar transporter subunit IIA n=1 Tax=unclassified Pseudomonas TaxID=196821 RepID=UPI001911E607|nr:MULTISPECIES: PTS sugar transporter subunit IIA [unclassified Pseudomonas]MBK5517846.1 PTS sugar transporter subunit IIA [Pseudomonas sp. TH10]MCH4876294.1 PTS sugar transporter subunit IIA [Pseudomonas sp. TMW22090]